MNEAMPGGYMVVTVLPVAGGVLGLLLRFRPPVLNAWALGVVMADLLALALSGGEGPGFAFMILSILAAAITFLGQQPQKEIGRPTVFTLVSLGLGLGAMTGTGPVHVLCFAGVLAVVLVATLLSHAERTRARGGAVASGIGLLCLLAAATLPGPASSVLLLAGSATALPLVPLHGAYLIALSELPGTFPAFLAVLLPLVGLSFASSAIPSLPTGLNQGLQGLALLSALYGSLKALVQFRMGEVISRASLAYLGLAWWYLATLQGVQRPAMMFIAMVSLSTGGLLLATAHIRLRSGHDLLDTLSGLAGPMPRLATLVVLLVMAAMGLPLFGLFSGLWAMLTAAIAVSRSQTCALLLIWLLASWHYTVFMQKALFGQVPASVPFRDLKWSETLALALVLMLLAAGGITEGLP
ncbi:MAG: proton-conducting transporter membrane subunit [bacterium]